MTNQVSIRKVELGPRSYNVHIGGSLSSVGKEMANLGLKGKALIVSHPRIMHLHGKVLIEGLRPYFDISVCEVPEGERSKSEKGLGTVYKSLQKNGLERKHTVVCFGGGVIGDLGGYAAGTWSGGINLVQVPTTLLAQVDASIGGKTAVNLYRTKNKIRIFKQPKLVFADITTLSTLPKRQFSNGMAEVMKYGILDENLWFSFRWFNEVMGLNEGLEISSSDKIEILRKNAPLREIIWRCANIKCDFVEKDEFDTKGIRAKLNLGHTIGHGIEGASNFKILHGEAVAIGLVAAAKLSVRKFGLNKSICLKLIEMLECLGLPNKLRKPNKELIFKLITQDKKAKEGKTPFVLFKKVGYVTFPHEVNKEEIIEVLKEVSVC